MPPKKAVSNGPILVHEDVFLRGRKFIEAKIAPAPPKGELTLQELCIPPIFHTLPELKSCVQFWSQQALVRLQDPKTVEPSRLSRTQSDKNLAPRPRKEMIEVTKYYAKQVKAAEKRTVQFLKQLEKTETKQQKRELQIQKVQDMEKSMGDELMECRKYAKRYELFEPKYMNHSKFGEKCPKKNVWIVAEASDLMSPFLGNVIEEIVKLVQTSLEENCNCFNLGIFGSDSWLQWCPTYQNPKDPKKGAADSLKWLNKNLTVKTCAGNAWPPKWVQMFESCFLEGMANPKMEPSCVFVACSKPPDDKTAVYDVMQGKGVPIQTIAFDDSMEEDEECKKFFETLAGPKGGMLVDTSMRDLQKVDKMLTSVKTKKKQVEKLQAQLAKMEDCSGLVAEHKKLLVEQISMEALIRNDLAVAEADVKGGDLQRDPDGNVVLPDSVVESMKEMGKKLAV